MDHIIYPIKPIHTIDDPKYFALPVFKYCDVFIHQSIRKGNRYGEEYSSEKIIARLDNNCQIIGIPNVYRLPTCVFPQYNKNDELKNRHGQSVFFRDCVLDEAAEYGLSFKKAFEDYWNNRHFSGRDLDEGLTAFFAKVDEREKDWDIKCLAFIKQNYKQKQLFYDPNHPTNEFLFYVATQLLKYMGIRTEGLTLQRLRLDILSGFEMPILPEVKEHYGMEFPYENEIRKNSDNKVRLGKMNIQSYIKQYLALSWQNPKVCLLRKIFLYVTYLFMKLYNRGYVLIPKSKHNCTSR